VGSQTTSYSYDLFGNLLHVTLPTGTALDYVVDGQNRRVGKMSAGTLTAGYLYQDALNVVAQLNASGSVVARFVFGTKSNVPDYYTTSAGTFRILSDHLGSPRLVVNTSTGAVVEEIDYDEFGNVTNDTAPGTIPYGFAGGLYDKDTGLVRFGARDYDATTGRWTSKDPLRFSGGSLNLYGYVVNDPIDFADPIGTDLSSWLCQTLGICPAGTPVGPYCPLGSPTCGSGFSGSGGSGNGSQGGSSSSTPLVCRPANDNGNDCNYSGYDPLPPEAGMNVVNCNFDCPGVGTVSRKGYVYNGETPDEACKDPTGGVPKANPFTRFPPLPFFPYLPEPVIIPL
jgi:RHS repeat-associated protein